MRKTVLAIIFLSIFVHFTKAQETQPSNEAQSQPFNEIQSKPAQQTQPYEAIVTAPIQISEAKTIINQKFTVVIKSGKNYSVPPITALIDKSYKNPTISNLAAEFRIRVSQRFILGLEFDHGAGIIKKEKIYSFAPILGIPDLKDIYTQKHTTTGFRINGYLTTINSRYYELAVGLGVGADVYTYNRDYIIQYFSGGAISQRTLHSSKNGVLPEVQIIISNQVKINRFSFLIEPMLSGNGVSVSFGSGVSF